MPMDPVYTTGAIPLASPLDRFEDVHRPGHVDLGTERWVGTAERHLQRGKVDDVGDAVFVQGAFDGCKVGDVPLDEIHACERVRLDDELDPSGILPEIEGDDRHALAHELADGPGADTAQGTGHEEALGVPAGPRRHAAAPDTDSTRQVFSSTPMPSISTVTRSPSARYRGGLRKAPTPEGVPVAITSPGSSVKAMEQ